MSDILSLLLTPMGIKTVTTGAGEVASFLRKRYGAETLAEAEQAHRDSLAHIKAAKVFVIGVPNDNGAGFDRGSKKGPLGLRNHWLENAAHYPTWEEQAVLDIGDVYDHPLLSEDRFLQEWVLDAVRRARWGERGVQEKLPVSALSILEVVLDTLLQTRPELRFLMLGGDHSKSLVPVQVLTRRLPRGTVGVLQFDAHTDLLETRDGLDGSYATWSWHANEALGRGGRLVQVGVRTSGRSKEEWESSLEIKQYWAHEVFDKGVEALADEIVQHFHAIGVTHLYISNDIDGLDPSLASATGTVEPDGLTLEQEGHLIKRMSEEFSIVGSDMMEVAPVLSRLQAGEPTRTLQSATELCKLQVEAMLSK